MESQITVSDVIHFWFQETKPKQWFEVDASFDQLISEKFRTVHSQAVRCELYFWRKTFQGRLAEIIVLDQFSRNIFRGERRAFAADALALGLAQEAVATGLASTLPPEQRSFLYMPYMHSESQRIHELALELFSEPGLENNFKFEKLHKAIIDRFGRFPHRNEILGRQSTLEEKEFLKGPGSSF